MAKIFPIYRKITNVIISSAGFIASVVKWGFKNIIKLYLIAFDILVGVKTKLLTKLKVKVNLGIFSNKPKITGTTRSNVNFGFQMRNLVRNLVTQIPSFLITTNIKTLIAARIKSTFTITLLGFVGVMDKIPLNIAARLSTVIRNYLVSSIPAANIVRIKYDVVGRKGANSVTQVNGPCGGQHFTNITYAIGLHDGQYTVCDGNLLAARCGRLNLGFAPSLGKTALTIVQVNLHFYYQVIRFISSSASGGYTLGGDTQLFVDNASVNYGVTPRTFDITAAIAGNWANIDSIGAYFIADIGVAAIDDNVSLDAIELEVISTLTEAV